MNAKHAPGPWELSHQLPEGFSIAKEVAPACGRLRVIAIACADESGWQALPESEAKANARLIAASPDLLAALQNALNVLAGVATGDLKTVTKDSPAIAQARSAIARATSVPVPE